MNIFRLIRRTLLHFKGTNLATSLGIAIATAVVCGALIIGDSLQMSLERIVGYRLGNITHTITAGERIFTREFAQKAGNSELASAPILKTEAIASIQGSSLRVNQVHVWGVDSLFETVAGKTAQRIKTGDNEIIINAGLAARLMVDTGDYILLRIKRIGPIPSNTPFVSESDQTITRRVKITDILSEKELGHFSMQASQSAPLNAFVNIGWLNRIMELDNMANMVVIMAEQELPPVQAQQMIRQAWTPDDGGINLAPVRWRSDRDQNQTHVQITSDRVFIDEYLSAVMMEVFADAVPTLTYFVNSLKFNGNTTPYSFVTAIDNFFVKGSGMGISSIDADRERVVEPGNIIPLEYGQIIVNQWLANDLGVNPGDSLLMRYYEIGPLRELVERESNFMVSHIIPMQRALQDSIFMPHLPGLSDAGSCRDWEAGIPIDLDAIRQKDEDYWDQFKGTPKAYISLEQGQHLWNNRFGKLTSVIIPDHQHSVETIKEVLSSHVDPMRLGFMVNAVREKGHAAARGGVDFGQLFAALGIFIIVSGLLLTLLLLRFSLKQRQSQMKLFVSLGFPNALIRKILVWEAFLVTLSGVILGLFVSIGYSKAVFSALNRNWQDIVRTDTLILHVEPSTLVIGLLVSLLLAMAVVYWGIRKAIKEYLPAEKKTYKVHPPQEQDPLKQTSPGQTDNKQFIPHMVTDKSVHKKSTPKRPNKIHAYLSAGSFFMAIALATYLGMTARFDLLFAWLATGVSLLTAIITRIFYVLHSSPGLASQRISLRALGWKNLIRNPLRSFTIILLLALGSFVIVVTAANRKEVYTDDTVTTSGTGGFQFVAETTVPILSNLDQTSTRVELGLPEEARFVQFLSTFDDDASCLNLNMVANPRILAAPPEHLEGRFSFVTRHAYLNPEAPWKSLDSTYQGIIPAIADQSVIQWGLGKRVGDTLVYANARGEEVRLMLIGGLANSVFQGNVIISAANFLDHFPESAGSNVVLIEAAEVDPLLLEEELGMIFRDYGWDMTSTLEKLAGFNTVENTYLQIFFLMGAFGMLLGTIGLAVVMAKSMVERRAETALLRALGYRTSHILRLFFYEYASLFLAGILAGTLSALLATLPNFLAANQNISTNYLAGVLFILIINGIFWMLVIPFVMVKRLRPLDALRNE